MKINRLLLSIPILIALLLVNQVSSSRDLNTADNVSFIVGEDKKAQFPGGTEAMTKWIGENLRYPKDIKRYGIVYIEFTVKKNGSCSDFTIKRGLEEDTNLSAVECLQGMPKWEAAMKEDKKVSSVVTLPIKFVREDKSSEQQGSEQQG